MSIYDDRIISLGPVGFWPINESAGTIVNDLSTNGNNGTYLNAPSLGQNPIVYSGLTDDLSVNFVSASTHGADLNFNPISALINGASAVTVEGWFTPGTLPASLQRNFYIPIDGANAGCSLAINASDQWEIQARSATADGLQTVVGPTVIANMKIHVVGVLDFLKNRIYLFLNGEFNVSASVTFSQNTWNVGTPTEDEGLIGRSISTNLYNGSASKLVIYAKGLTPLEIRGNYNLGKANGFDKEALDLGLSGYLPLDELTGSSIDRVNENNGGHISTVQGVSAGLVSNLNSNDFGVTFNGATSLITITDQTAIQNIFDGGGTVFVWVIANSDGELDVARVIDKRGISGTGWFIGVREESAGLVKVRVAQEFSTTLGLWDTTSTELTLSVGDLIAVTYDNGNVGNIPIIYIRGVSVPVTTTQTPVGTRDSDIGENLVIGNTADSTVTFDGEISKFGVANSIKTAAQIRTLYESAIQDLINRGFDKFMFNLGLEGYWRLDEGRVTTVFDDSGNSRDGVINGDVVVDRPLDIAQEAHTGMLFDGTGDFIGSIGTLADFSYVQNTGVFSISVLFSLSDSSADAAAIAIGNNSSLVSENGFSFFYENRSGEIPIQTWRFFLTDGTTTILDFSGSNNLVTDNNLHLIAITGDGTNARLYFDGVLDSTSAAMGTLAAGNSTNLLNIGRANALSSLEFDGVLAKISMANFELTSQQVKQMQQARISRMAAEVISKGPEGYFRLNEGTGTVAEDFGFGGNDGTYVNAPGLGQTDSPVTNEPGHTTTLFDGIDDHVDITGILATQEDITMMTWVNYPVVPVALEVLLSNRGAATELHELLVQATGVPGVSMRDSGNVLVSSDSPQALITDTWFFLAGVFDHTNSALKKYVDSLLVAEDNTVLAGTITTTSQLIASTDSGGGPTSFSTGKQSEVAIFTTLLTPTDILDIQEAATLLVAGFFGLTGNLTENFSLEDWRVRLYRLDTGAFLGEGVVDIPTKTYSVNISSTGFIGPLLAIMMPDVKVLWSMSLPVLLGDYIIPTDPTNPSNFFKAVQAGTTGGTEPTWVISGNTNDGTVIWEDQGSLIEPKVQSPRLPA